MSRFQHSLECIIRS